MVGFVLTIILIVLGLELRKPPNGKSLEQICRENIFC